MTKRIWKDWRVQRSKPKGLNIENIQRKRSWLPRGSQLWTPNTEPFITKPASEAPGHPAQQTGPVQQAMRAWLRTKATFLPRIIPHTFGQKIIVSFAIDEFACSETSYKENYTLYAQKDSFTFRYKAGCIHWAYYEMQFSLLGSPILQSRVPRALMLLGRTGYRWSSSQQPEYQSPTQTPRACCVRARVLCCLQGGSHSWF